MAFTYKKLWGDYNRFNVPAAEIKINGKDLVTFEKCNVNEVIATISSACEAGSAVVSVSTELGENALENLLQIGVKAEISFGYENKVKLVFTGYLHRLSLLQSGEGTGYELVFLDCKGLMVLQNSMERDEKKKFSDIISGILSASRYSGFYSEKSIERIPPAFDLPSTIASKSDFDFVCEWARLLDFRFFISSDTLYFASDCKSESNIELELENGIISSETAVSLYGQVKKITSVSFDDNGKRILSAAQRISEKGFASSKLNSVIGGEKTFTYPAFNKKEQLEYLAGARMREAQRNCLTLEAACIGLPELLPPNTLTYGGKNWRITEAVHKLNKFGYRTEVKAYCE